MRLPYRYQRPEHGEWGSITHIGSDRLMCHICGRDYKNVGLHAWWAHELTASEYRLRFHLGATVALTGKQTSRRLSANNLKLRREGRLSPVIGSADPNTGRDPEEVRSSALRASRISAERRKTGLAKQNRHQGGRWRGLSKAARAVVDAYRADLDLSEPMAALTALVYPSRSLSAVGSAVAGPESGGDERIRTAE